MQIQSLFKNIGDVIEYKKGDVLFRQGEVNTSLFFVSEGLLKAYYVTFEGRELIKSFIQEDEFIGSLISCRTKQPSTFTVKCIEDSTVMCVAFDSLLEAKLNPKDISNLMIEALFNLSIKKEQREYEFLCLSAPERYSIFKEKQPNLIERITQNDLARYLGITPVALSRIKNRD